MAEIHTYITLTRDEIQATIPYMMVAETTSRSVWNTGARKRRWTNQFTASERDKMNTLIRQAHKWAFKTGAPESLTLLPTTLIAWGKLTDFCATL